MNCRQLFQAGWRFIDNALRLERSDDVVRWYKGVFADHAQQAWRRESTQLTAMPGKVLPQPDDIADRPTCNQLAKAALLMRHIKNELGISRNTLELAQMTNNPFVLHQAFQMLLPHEHDLVWRKAEKCRFESRPFGIHQAVLEARPKHPQRNKGEVAVIGNRAQLTVRTGLRQMGLQLRCRTKAVQAILMQPFIVTHRAFPATKGSKIHHLDKPRRRLFVDFQTVEIEQGAICQL